MSLSLLSVFAKPTHSNAWLEYVTQLKPYDILLLDPDIQQVSDAHVASPDSEITIRRWDWDDARTEQNPDGIYGRLRDDPEGLAAWQVEQYAELIRGWEDEAKRRGLPWPDREQLVMHLTNEPDTNTLMAQINRTTVVGAKLAWNFGCKVDGLNLSTGHPAHLFNGQSDWRLLLEALEALEKTGSYATVHEYRNSLGIRHPDTYPWHITRHHWAPRGPRYKIGEYGLEEILNGVMADHHGWMGRVSPEQMLADTDWYLGQVRDDVVAVRWYMTDFADRRWRTFDSTPLHPQLVEIGRRHVRAAPKPQPNAPIPVPQPPPPSVPPAQPSPGKVSPKVLSAILRVESGGRAFGDDKRLLIRFEAHIFGRYADPGFFVLHFKHDAAKPWMEQHWREQPNAPWRPVHTGQQADEWAAFEFAASHNQRAAMLSISMGAPQIMGFNYATAGYSTVQSMFDGFTRGGEQEQTLAFMSFLLNTDGMLDAIRRKDWRTIARLYNGPGNIEVYADLLRKAYLAIQ
jgi:hypothetical protein